MNVWERTLVGLLGCLRTSTLDCLRDVVGGVPVGISVAVLEVGVEMYVGEA